MILDYDEKEAERFIKAYEGTETEARDLLNKVTEISTLIIQLLEESDFIEVLRKSKEMNKHQAGYHDELIVLLSKWIIIQYGISYPQIMEGLNCNVSGILASTSSIKSSKQPRTGNL